VLLSPQPLRPRSRRPNASPSASMFRCREKYEDCWRFAPQCCAWQSVYWRRRVRRRSCGAPRSVSWGPTALGNYLGTRLTPELHMRPASRTHGLPLANTLARWSVPFFRARNRRAPSAARGIALSCGQSVAQAHPALFFASSRVFPQQ
jgi:hypothetical protein